MNHRVARLIFSLGVGLIVAILAYRWITDPAPRAERQQEEAVVVAARQYLQEVMAPADIELVDPLAPNRKIGKAYVYRAASGWEVSGYYRREEGDRWHPFLLALDTSLAITNLKVQDAALIERAAEDAKLEAIP